MKLIAISILLVLTSGCLFSGKTTLMGLGIIATGYKYNSDKKKTEAINRFRDEVRGDLALIKKELETE